MRKVFAALAEYLQPNYPRAAVAPDIAVERVPCIDNQRTPLANAFVVRLAVVGDNHHAIRRPQLFIGQRHGGKWFAATFSVRIVEVDLTNKWIVITHVGAFRAQAIDDRQRRTLA